jgi:hypothetical protein
LEGDGHCFEQGKEYCFVKTIRKRAGEILSTEAEVIKKSPSTSPPETAGPVLDYGYLSLRSPM